MSCNGVYVCCRESYRTLFSLLSGESVAYYRVLHKGHWGSLLCGWQRRRRRRLCWCWRWGAKTGWLGRVGWLVGAYRWRVLISHLAAGCLAPASSTTPRSMEGSVACVAEDSGCCSCFISMGSNETRLRSTLCIYFMKWKKCNILIFIYVFVVDS